MKLSACAALAVLSVSLHAGAQDHGYWKAVSTTARGITGDIGIANERLTINFTNTTLAEIRAVTPAEGAAVFPLESGQQGTGNLYRLSIPAKRTFLHRNPLCGAEDTQWLLTFVTGKTLQAAFFSGTAMPVLTQEAVANSTALCGTFTYGR